MHKAGKNGLIANGSPCFFTYLIPNGVSTLIGGEPKGFCCAHLFSP